MADDQTQRRAAFPAGLTPDERRVLGAAPRCIQARVDEAAGDVAGRMVPGGPPLIAVGMAQQAAVCGPINQVLEMVGVRT